MYLLNQQQVWGPKQSQEKRGQADLEPGSGLSASLEHSR